MRRIAIIGGALVGIAAILAAVGLFWFFGGDAPEAASVDAALAQAAASSPSPVTPASPTVLASGTAAATATPGAPVDLAGTYQVVKGDGTFAGYRIKEELRTIGSNTAVGRSPDVTGSLTFEGKVITAVEVTVSVASLKSDDSRRDNFMQRNGLQTQQFPTTTFVLSQPIAISSLPAEGEKAKFEATGDFTLHGVTRRVTIPLEGARQAGTVVVAGSLEVVLADYKIQKPVASTVLSINDKGLMEFQITFRK
ncbi:MAG: YceI family protein [Dehalococcoidia bacterium]|nr:MAG: YceI family protein [Dehalococcoidia bacterium]